MDGWDSDSYFGFEGASAGGNTATAPTPNTPATSPVQPAGTAWQAILDPKGSAIFWVALFGVLGLAMVSGQLAISAKVAGRGGRR